MNKTKIVLYSALFCLLGASCAQEPKDVEVSEVTLDKNSANVYIERSLQLNATVLPDNATNKTISWVSSNPDIATVDEDGNVTAGTSGGTTTITVISEDGEKTATCSVTVEKYWTIAEENEMNGQLYNYVLPYVDGASANWSIREQAIVVNGPQVDLSSLTAYCSLIEADGFAKSEVSTNVFRFAKEVAVSNNQRNLQVDVCAVNANNYAMATGNGKLLVTACDPYEYEWPIAKLAEVYETFSKTSSCVVPEFGASKYLSNIITGQVKGLHIECDGNSTKIDNYKTLLNGANFTVSSQVDENGYWVAKSPDNIIKVSFKLEGTKVIIEITQCAMWPEREVNTVVAYFTNNSGTTLPALPGAEKYEYSEAALTNYGYYTVMCTVISDPTEEYKTILNNAGYTVFPKPNTAANYYATSQKEDMLVQFKYDDFGKSQFDIMFQKMSVWNEEEIASKLALVSDTEDTLPIYDGVGVVASNNSLNDTLTISIKSATYASVDTYAEILTELGWTVEKETYYTYFAISSDRKAEMEIYIDVGNRWVTLVISAHEDSYPYATWPTTQVNDLITSLGLTSSLPAFEGALGFDIDTSYYLNIIAYVNPSDVDKLLEDYATLLESEGFVETTDGAYIYFVNEDYLAVCPYASYVDENKIIIELSKWTGELPGGEESGGQTGETTSFPSNLIEQYFGSTVANAVPVANGTSFATEYDSINGLTITVTGGDYDEYIQQLDISSFYNKDVLSNCISYSERYYSYGVDVYKPDSNGVYDICVWGYLF